MFYVYILKSIKTGRFYVGMTSDLSKRVNAHNEGKNISTRFGRPWDLVHKEKFFSKNKAWLRERKIKKYKKGEAFKKLIQ